MKKIKSILKRGLVNMGNNQLRMWGYMTRYCLLYTSDAADD